MSIFPALLEFMAGALASAPTLLDVVDLPGLMHLDHVLMMHLTWIKT
jgi:hypothetical protein